MEQQRGVPEEADSDDGIEIWEAFVVPAAVEREVIDLTWILD